VAGIAHSCSVAGMVRRWTDAAEWPELTAGVTIEEMKLIGSLHAEGAAFHRSHTWT
jgi:hypothetical protein